MATYLSSYTIILVVINVVVTSKFSTCSKNHAYFSTNEDSQYVSDTVIPVSFHKGFSGGTGGKISIDESLFSSRIQLKFLPPVLDFKERYLGIPHEDKVTIINLSCNRTVFMSSISGNSVQFHSSFFQDKVIPPLGNTSFSVIFLGRHEGVVDSYLFIHTSEGSFKYQVRGESVSSPYRIRPLSGIRLPLNATYSPVILLHNPHQTSLQLLEVYSSGNDFHLELPSGELGGPKHIWQIPAFLTKPIIRLKFHATSQKNHTAYIRLKVDKDDEALVVPVDVEVSANCGLYAQDDLLNFGIGGTNEPPKRLKLYLRNSWKKPIKVQNIISSPISKALKIDFQPMTVPPKHKHPTEVGVLIFDWKTAYETGESFGRIVIKSNQSGQRLILSYKASVLGGGLEYNNTQMKFKSDEPEIEPRSITIKNNFKIPVAITNVSLLSSVVPYFQVKNFSSVILFPGEKHAVLILSVKRNFILSGLKIKSALQISSNASSLSVPLLCYDGKLKKVITWDANDTCLNLGTVGIGTIKKVYFGLLNENPIDVHITKLEVNILDAAATIIYCGSGNETNVMLALASEYNSNETRSEFLMTTGDYCIIQASIPSGQEIRLIEGKVSVFTEFENIEIPFMMKIDHGSLEVTTNPVNFNNCFPNAVCSAKLIVESHFTMRMAISGLRSIPNHRRLGFIPSSSPHILPFTKTFLGHVTWNMSGTESYRSLITNSSGVHKWFDTLELPIYTREWDITLLVSHYKHYLRMAAELMKLSLWLDTTEVRNLSFKALMKPTWPSISSVPSKVVEFPLTQVGNISYNDIIITNPSSQESIVVQLVLEPNYPLSAGLINEFPSRLRPFNMTYETVMDHSDNLFYIVLDRVVKLPLSVKPHKKSVTFLLEPSSNVLVTLAFRPERAEVSTSLLMIRNNLTVLEVVKLVGSGAYAQFKFGNRRPGSNTPLLFELADKHLRDCERDPKEKEKIPNLTVRRSFIARNTGALSLNVIGFTINGHPCQGFGFRVLNCQPFQLPANSSRKIDIAFTPDFTLSRVTRILTVLTIDSAVNYTLTATLPPYLLSACSNIIKRPTWEPVVYYCAVSFMFFLLICVLGAAYFESNRILRNTIITLSRENNVQPVLDLRMIGSDVGGPDPNPMQAGESQCNIIWTSNVYNEEQANKEIQKPLGESIFSINCSNKCQILNNGINCKKKSDRTICKRYSDGSDNFIEKTCWETSFSRANNSQLVKPLKTSICITTEPYIPLTNIKSRDSSLQKPECTANSKFEQPRFIEFQPRKTKKKSHTLQNIDVSKKKPAESLQMRNIFEESESSSSTSESSSSDDAEKDVESMFFQSVRHHLQTKVARGRHMKISGSSPLTKRKKPFEKSQGNMIDNEWEIEEDDATEKAIVVRNNRRSTTSGVKQLKKQTANYGKLRFDQSQTRGKQISDRTMKSSIRKEKTQAAKKRNERIEKRMASAKSSTIILAQENSAPPLPSPPIWTASFSDVVAGTDVSYSSVVATKCTGSFSSHKHQHNLGPTDPLNQSSSNNTKSFPLEWKAEYQDAVEQLKHDKPNADQSPSLQAETSHPLNSIWGNWSSLTESLQAQSNVLQAATNSLFTDSSTQQNSNYDPLWNDQALLKANPDDVENNQTFHEMNWPVITSLWEPLYTPSASTVETPPPVWGSDVWGPPAPPTPNPPLSEEMVQNSLEYDPFRSLSNIWAQHSPHIWKPPSKE